MAYASAFSPSPLPARVIIAGHFREKLSRTRANHPTCFEVNRIEPAPFIRVSIIFQRLEKRGSFDAMEIRRDYLIELERRGSSTIGKSLESIVTGRLKIEFTTNDREGRYSFRRLIDTDGKSVEIGALFLHSRFTRPSSLHVLTAAIRRDHVTATIKSVTISGWKREPKVDEEWWILKFTLVDERDSNASRGARRGLNAGCSPITHRRDLIYHRYSFALSRGN